MTRSKTKIIQDILETIKKSESCNKTKIVRLANLDWNMVEKYVPTLIEEGFIKKQTVESGKGNESYFLTDEGEELLKTVKDLRNLSKIF